MKIDKLLREYTALASAYDQRWSAYLDASLRMTFDNLDKLAAEQVLDVGCGTGQLLQVLAERSDTSELVGIDRVPAMLDVARQRLGQRATLLEGEAAQLPFADAYFQLITSTNALHYFPDVDAALREFRRVITANGHLVITDWCRDYLWMRWLNRILPWTQHAHERSFTLDELEQSLMHAGFKVQSKSKNKIDWFWGLMTVHVRPN